MSDLFAMSMPWWELMLRAVVVYFVLLALIRLSGKRTIGQYTPFDLLLVVLLGNAVQNALLGQDQSLSGGLLLAATLITLNWLIGWIGARNTRLDRMLTGEPVVLAHDGKVYQAALRRQNISASEFEEAMREAECESYADIHLALLETNGRISIIKRSDHDHLPERRHPT